MIEWVDILVIFLLIIPFSIIISIIELELESRQFKKDLENKTYLLDHYKK